MLETRAEYNARFGQEPRDGPQVPGVVGHVYDWFFILSAKRRREGSVPQPLTYAEVEAWSRLTGTVLRHEEVSMIMAMDNAWVVASSTEARSDALRTEGRAKLKHRAKPR